MEAVLIYLSTDVITAVSPYHINRSENRFGCLHANEEAQRYVLQVLPVHLCILRVICISRKEMSHV